MNFLDPMSMGMGMEIILKNGYGYGYGSTCPVPAPRPSLFASKEANFVLPLKQFYRKHFSFSSLEQPTMHTKGRGPFITCKTAKTKKRRELYTFSASILHYSQTKQTRNR